MLLSSLAHADRTFALHPLFAEAFAWLAKQDQASMKDGKYVIRGEDLFVTQETGSSKDPAIRRFEAHRRYIDIQVVLQGEEVMYWTPLAGMTLTQDFAEGGDIAFYSNPARQVVPLYLSAGHFAIFWPEDAHKPVCHPASGPSSYTKLVFKVALKPG